MSFVQPLGCVPSSVRSGVRFAVLFLCSLTPGAWGQDMDGDGVYDAQDVCNNTPPGIAVDSKGRPRGDLDLDCDTDMDDFALFQTGFTGPLAVTQEQCADGVDNDGDGLVDCADVLDCPTGVACSGGLFCTQFATCGCPNGYADCNGIAEDGCETALNTNPTCADGQHNVGTIRGDQGSDVRTYTGRGERWFRVWITESVNFEVYLSARIELESGGASNYDLYVYCDSCGGQLAGSSTNPDDNDLLTVARNDDWGSEDSFSVIIEVRYISRECEDYTLRVIGNTIASSFTCD